ncbi:MAG: endolytic transglycosylase MltG [Ignavibacteriales bacterium]|nr:MAG: endolytic transglycosylase MltG [Ignavibacteriales bacterium]
MLNKQKKKYMKPGEFILVILFFLFVLGILYYIFFTPNYYDKESPVKFEIKRGEPLSSVIERLYEEEIIPSRLNMRIASFIYGAERRVRAARYSIPNGLSYLDLLELFLKGDADFLKSIKIFDGMTTEWIASRMRTDLLMDSTEFMSYVKNDSLTALINPELKSLEGYLLPMEYYFYENSSPVEVLGAFIEEFNKFVKDSLKRKADEPGYSLNEVITVASIIEGETNNTEEMPLIAGVYYNRLQNGMRLQADPTIQYILKEWRRLTFKDLMIDSPFNTYKYSGLPPHPINNPGKNAIRAAFYPAKHKYLYFVADTLGGHKFSETFAEHTRNAGVYRKWLDGQ